MPVQLPVDIWDLVSNFVHEDSLGQVSQELREALGNRRYVKLTCNTDAVKRIDVIVGNVRSLQLTVTDPTAVTVLKTARHMHTLDLDASGCQIGDQGAQALVALKHAPKLQTLSINLKQSAIGASGALALATLKESPSLRTLLLDLESNNLGTGWSCSLPGLIAVHLHLLLLGSQGPQCDVQQGEGWLVGFLFLTNTTRQRVSGTGVSTCTEGGRMKRHATALAPQRHHLPSQGRTLQG